MAGQPIVVAMLAVLVTIGSSMADRKQSAWDDRIRKATWQFRERSTLDWVRSIDSVDVTLSRRAGSRDLDIVVSRRGTTLHAWTGTSETPMIVEGELLYYVAHREISSGATLVAVELATGKLRWRTPLRGLGPIGHSQYRNQVWLAVEADVLMVQSVESSGKYIELVDKQTGKTVANKQVKP